MSNYYENIKEDSPLISSGPSSDIESGLRRSHHQHYHHHKSLTQTTTISSEDDTLLNSSSSNSNLLSNTITNNPIPSHVSIFDLINNFIQKNAKFFFITSGVLFFFTLHNYLQELIMNLPNFNNGSFLGFLEVLGVTICSYIEMKFIRQEKPSTQPKKLLMSSYFLLCFCLFISSSTSNMALNYINYPTKVIFRSCKLIPTIIIAIILLKKKITLIDFILYFLITLGMIIFVTVDIKILPNFNFFGIFLVTVSVVADSFLPNLQEKMFSTGSTRLEMTFYTNILCLVFMSFSFFTSGDLFTGINYALTNPHAFYLMSIYTFLAYIAISFHMTLVKEYGSIVAVLVGNTRKVLTILLSFILFPKPFSFMYVIGIVLVFGSLIMHTILKENRKKENVKN